MIPLITEKLLDLSKDDKSQPFPFTSFTVTFEFYFSFKILPHQLVQTELYNVANKGLIDKGLSMLVNRTLGKSLDKTFQVSDWERRPLQEQQLYYAGKGSFLYLAK